jgi:hypothetical protein
MTTKASVSGCFHSLVSLASRDYVILSWAYYGKRSIQLVSLASRDAETRMQTDPRLIVSIQ